MMRMHNPPHPGEFIKTVYREPNGLSVRGLAESLGVTPSTVMRIINGTSPVAREMALRPGKAPGRSPESWLTMQLNYDPRQTKKAIDVSGVKQIGFADRVHPAFNTKQQ